MRISPSSPMLNSSSGPMIVVEPYSSITAGPRPENPIGRAVAVVDGRGKHAFGLQEIDRSRVDARWLGGRGWPVASRASPGPLISSVAVDCTATNSIGAFGRAWP